MKMTSASSLQYNIVPNKVVIIPRTSSVSIEPNRNSNRNSNSKKSSVSCFKHIHFNNKSGSFLAESWCFSINTNNNNINSIKISALHKSKAAVVTKDSWERSILKSELPVLVEFYAGWCGPCRMVHRLIDEIAAEYAGELKCFVLNTDNDPQIAEDYDVKAVPLVVFIKNGAQCESIAGTMPKEFYVAAIERILKS